MGKNSIHQILPSISYGDAVSNHALFIQEILRQEGCASNIYAKNIHPKLAKNVIDIREYSENSKDTIIHHFSTGDEVNRFVTKLKCYKKIMVYHNITPKKYFEGYNAKLYFLADMGRKQLKEAVDTYQSSICDSRYNATELEKLRYKNLEIVPITFDFDDYMQKPDTTIVSKYGDKRTNILFVGRVAPNKKQEDIIKAFYYYKKFIDPTSRLFIVGSYEGMETYYSKLIGIIKQLELEDVYFTGHTSFSKIIAYYSVADIFLCMSEHEGFCVPLLEAMFFNVPILAYEAAAIPETLGKSGITFNEKNYHAVAEMVYLVMNNPDLREKIKLQQKARLLDFRKESIADRLKNIILN